jgi:8-oxo-dGTP diphosphatase
MRPLAVDAIIIYRNKLVFIKRVHEPYKDKLALPGGFVKDDETVEEAVIREAKEETGLDAGIIKLTGVYSEPHRDPRGPVVSICFILKATGGELKAATDAKDAVLLDINDIPELAFDHNRMIDDAKKEDHLNGILSGM